MVVVVSGSWKNHPKKEDGDMPLKKVYSAKITLTKFIKGTVGGLVVFALLRTVMGRDVGWDEVNEFRGLILATLPLFYGLYEAVYNVVKFFAGDKIKEEVGAVKDTIYHFTHKDAD